jgi:snurportin-1
MEVNQELSTESNSTQENRRQQLLVRISSNTPLENELNIQDLNLSDDESSSHFSQNKRGFEELDSRYEDDDQEMAVDNSVENHPKWNCQRKQKNQRKKEQRSREFLTMPEDFSGTPMEFTTDWLVVCLPKGVRCAVTSSKGTTLSRTHEGKFLSEFKSLLPGGSLLANGSYRKNEFSILDCIFDQFTSTYHIVDIMCFNGYPVTSCETEFRHFWLKSKFADFHPKYASELRTQSNVLSPTSDFYFPQSNDPKLRYRFSMLPILNCTSDNLNQMLSSIEEHKLHNSIQGFYFVHKKSPYLRGSSPLALFLPAHLFTKDWILANC